MITKGGNLTKPMTVKKLKKLLAKVPDYFMVAIPSHMDCGFYVVPDRDFTVSDKFNRVEIGG